MIKESVPQEERNKLIGTQTNPIISSAKRDDINNLIQSYKDNRQKQLNEFNSKGEGFNPESGNFVNNDTSFWDNKISKLEEINAKYDAEVAELEKQSTPNSKGEGTGSVQTAESKGEQKRSKQAIQAEIKSVNNSIAELEGKKGVIAKANLKKQKEKLAELNKELADSGLLNEVQAKYGTNNLGNTKFQQSTDNNTETTPQQQKEAKSVIKFLSDKFKGLFVSDQKAFDEKVKQITNPRFQALQNKLAGQYDFLFNGKPVAELKGNEFEAKTNLGTKEQIINFYNKIGNKVQSVFGDVLLDERSVKNDTAHKLTRNKVALFKAIPEILKNGIEILPFGQHKKGETTNSGMIAAPITIGWHKLGWLSLLRQPPAIS